MHFVLELLFVGRLADVCFPSAFAYLEFGKYCRERGVFGAARVYAEGNFPRGCGHVAYPHLAEVLPVERTFDAKIILASAKTVPYLLYVGTYGGGGPVRKAACRDHAAKMLKFAVFMLA